VPITPKDHIAALPPLPIGESKAPDGMRPIVLSNNENAEAPSQSVLDAMAAAASGTNRYPDVTHATLRSRIAEVYGGLDPNRILCGVGSSELIAALAACYAGAGDEVLVGQHGYLYFSIATWAAGGTIVKVRQSDGRNDPSIDLGAVLDAVTERTRIVFLDNPSNPLGTAHGASEIAAFRAKLPEDVLLVLDSAYADYSTDPGVDGGEALVDATDNTVCLRTFSKIYGLAGLRVGWGYFPSAIAETVGRFIRPGPISDMSLAGALASLGEADIVSERRSRNGELRDRFSAVLNGLPGVSVLPSHSNFVLATFSEGSPHTAAHVFEAMKAKGILLRPMGPYELPNSLRITIGTEEEMAITSAAFQELFA